MKVAGGPTASELYRYVRRRRLAHRRLDWTERLYRIYLAVAASIAILVALYASVKGSDPGAGVAPAVTRFLDRFLALGFAAAMLAGLRFSTWQGPVVFSAADIGLLLSAPIPRSDLIRPKLMRGLATGTLAGIGLGVATAVILEAITGKPLGPLAVATIGSIGLLALLVAALGWHIECTSAAARLVVRFSAPLFISIAIFAFVVSSAGAGLERVLVWSGPWGWAAGPIIATAGGSVGSSTIPFALLATAAAVAVGTALMRAGAATSEELGRRAEARRGLVAAAFVMDFRGLVLAQREAGRKLVGIRLLRLPRPSRPLLSIPWRDAMSALRAPGAIVSSAFLVVTGLALAAHSNGNIRVVAGAIALGYLGAARLVEPIRVEADNADAARSLPWRYGEVVLLHSVVPAAIVIGFGILATLGLAVAGVIEPGTLFGWVAVAIAAGSLLIGIAACIGPRGRLPIELMILGGMELVVIWYAAGPVLAELAVGLPTLLLLSGLDADPPASNPFLMPIVTTGVILWLIYSYLHGRHIPD